MASRATAWRRESSRARSFGGFLKIGHLPGFRGPSKTADRYFVDVAASQKRLRVEERNSAVDRVCTAGCCRPDRSDRSPGPVWPQQPGINTPTNPWVGESLESFVF